MKIKICGLFRNEDIDAVNEAMPDYIGFVFAKSRRQVTKAEAMNLSQRLHPKIKKVGVFVDSDIHDIVMLVQENIIDMVQLHGHEDQSYISNLRKNINIPIIKAVNVDNFNLYTDIDYYLFDSIIAGSGQCFDWRKIPQMKLLFFLAGGIDLNNIDDALKVDCLGLDISSGVETNGYKDKEKIKRIVRKVKYGNR